MHGHVSQTAQANQALVYKHQIHCRDKTVLIPLPKTTNVPVSADWIKLHNVRLAEDGFKVNPELPGVMDVLSQLLRYHSNQRHGIKCQKAAGVLKESHHRSGSVSHSFETYPSPEVLNPLDL